MVTTVCLYPFQTWLPPPQLWGLSRPVNPQGQSVWLTHFCLCAPSLELRAEQGPVHVSVNACVAALLCREMAFVPLESRPPTCPPAVASPCGS